MDVLYFLKERMKFIRSHYDSATAPFRETIRKIEAEEPPYEPPYSEDGEPPFLAEWIDANTSVELIGLSCVSMLSESLKLYFMTWERELGIRCSGELAKEFKQFGFLHGYKLCFGQALEIDWALCPADFDILEQIVLARNRSQHPDNILDMKVRHSGRDREKYPMPFFVSEYEKQMLGAGGLQEVRWINPSLAVSRETLLIAIAQVERLAGWLEDQMFTAKYP